MFITKECDYAIRIIRALADGSRKTVKKISQEEHMPEKFVHNITTKLERAQFIQSFSGRGGGVRLRRPLNEFSLIDVVLAIDENRRIGDCLGENTKCAYVDATQKPCTVHVELERIQNVLIETMRAKTMDMVLFGEEAEPQAI